MNEIVDLLRGAENVVVLTGAGVSAESGIPTFREAQTGLWAQFDPEELANPAAFKQYPDRVWQWYAWRRELIANCKPNAGHNALVELEQRIPNLMIVTQNVDGLHHTAGSQHVLELHGNIQRCKCFECNRPTDDWDRAATSPPPCPTCGGMLRPDVVWFGEQLDGEVLENAINTTLAADVVLSIGTSSLVTPAAYIPQIALQERIPVVEINPNPTPITNYVQHVVSAAAGVVLPTIVTALL